MREHVRYATGLCVLSATSMGATLGGGAVTPRGGMATLGGGTATLGVGTCCAGVGGVAGSVVTGGTGDIVGGAMVGLGIQFVKMSQSFEMAVSCSLWMAAGSP